MAAAVLQEASLGHSSLYVNSWVLKFDNRSVFWTKGRGVVCTLFLFGQGLSLSFSLRSCAGSSWCRTWVSWDFSWLGKRCGLACSQVSRWLCKFFCTWVLQNSDSSLGRNGSWCQLLWGYGHFPCAVCSADRNDCFWLERLGDRCSFRSCSLPLDALWQTSRFAEQENEINCTYVLK